MLYVSACLSHWICSTLNLYIVIWHLAKEEALRICCGVIEMTGLDGVDTQWVAEQPH